MVGPPSETVVGKPLGFAANVLYKDSDGTKGRCYYFRPDQNVRLFFRGYKVCGLYVTLESGKGEESFTTVRPIKEVKDYQDVRFKDMSKLDLTS